MKTWMLIALGLALSSSTFALELQLPSIFADHMVLQRDQKVPVWGTAEAGATVVVKFSGQEKQTITDQSGQWRIDLDALEASAKPRSLSVIARSKTESVEHTIVDVLVGEVWLASGQSNMYRPFRMLIGPAEDKAYEPIAEYLRDEAANANDPLMRQYRVGRDYSMFEARSQGRGEWMKAVAGEVNEYCGTAYFFARELRRELQVPVAMISCNLGGTRIEPWIAPEAFSNNAVLQADYQKAIIAHQKRLDEWDDTIESDNYKKAVAAWDNDKKGSKPRKPEHPSRDKQSYGTLYNGMIAPLIPYAIKGAIWYQGESNTANYPEQYDSRLTALIVGWRTAWGQGDFPFYWCQLANYRANNEDPVGDEDTWALLQNQQRMALIVPNTGMAVLNDIGEARDIHPKNKIDAGKRLSLWALKQAYGRDLVYSGPLFKEAKLKDSKFQITFDQVGSGLMVGHKHLMEPTVEVDAPLKRFQICGSDGKWQWAQAKIITKDSVLVWHDKIRKPVEVRYAWSTNPEGANLYNKEGLPTSVFKTANTQQKSR